MIDVTTPGSPGWWMQELFGQLQHRNRRRFKSLHDYYRGRPPLPLATADQKSVFYSFQRTARSNFAELIVLAPVDKTKVRAIRTAVNADENGDPEAQKVWNWNGLDVTQTQVYTWAKEFGEAYVSVGIDPDDPYPTICPEDPRQCITVQHPTKPWQAAAALKVLYDPIVNTDYAYLWMPGRLYVAYAPRSGPAPGRNRVHRNVFNASSFTMAPVEGDPEAPRPAGYSGPLSQVWDDPTMLPVIRFANRDCRGEYESHTDLIDRINHMILQRVVIATMQAYRQRALELDEELPKVDPETGEPIDYNKVFTADPGALWLLPKGAKIWESQQTTIQDILAGVKDDVLHLAAETRTPLVMFTPDAATQTAEGADLQVDGLTTKVEYDQLACGRSWAQVYSVVFALQGDTERADVAQITVDWFPAKRVGIEAAAQADSLSSLPFEDKLRRIYQMSPAEIASAVTNRSADLAFQAAVAAITQPAAPTGPAPPAPAQQGQPQRQAGNGGAAA